MRGRCSGAMPGPSSRTSIRQRRRRRPARRTRIGLAGRAASGMRSHRLLRVGQQVDEHQAQPLGVGPDRRAAARCLDMRSGRRRAPSARPGRRYGPLDSRSAGATSKAIGRAKSSTPVTTRLTRATSSSMLRRGLGHFGRVVPPQAAHRRLDDHQRIANLVRDHGRQAAERRQPLARGCLALELVRARRSAGRTWRRPARTSSIVPPAEGRHRASEVAGGGHLRIVPVRARSGRVTRARHEVADQRGDQHRSRARQPPTASAADGGSGSARCGTAARARSGSRRRRSAPSGCSRPMYSSRPERQRGTRPGGPPSAASWAVDASGSVAATTVAPCRKAISRVRQRLDGVAPPPDRGSFRRPAWPRRRPAGSPRRAGCRRASARTPSDRPAARTRPRSPASRPRRRLDTPGLRQQPAVPPDDDEEVGAEALLVLLGDRLDGGGIVGRGRAPQHRQVADQLGLDDEVGELRAADRVHERRRLVEPREQVGLGALRRPRAGRRRSPRRSTRRPAGRWPRRSGW